MRDFFRASIAKNRGEEGRANPLFPAKKMPRWKRWFFAFSGLALPIGGGIFGIHTLSQPQFLITTIDLTGTACLDKDVVKKEIEKALQERSWIFFTNENRLLFHPQTVSQHLMSHFPIDHVNATLDGNTLHVAIQEDVVMVLVHTANDWLLTDLNGKILRPLTAEEIPLIDSAPTVSEDPSEPQTLPFDKIPKILLSESVPPDTTDALYPAKRLSGLAELDKRLRTIGLTPDRYQLEKRKDTWLAVSTREKPYEIYIDLENPIDSQIKILESILTQHEEIPGMSYVDLRFGNRVYMK